PYNTPDLEDRPTDPGPAAEDDRRDDRRDGRGRRRAARDVSVTTPDARIDRGYALARERYAELGVDADAALAALAAVPVSLHCWQGDDVRGFEGNGAALGGGLAVTGDYPGRARTADELRQDADAALALIPGAHRFNL